MHEQEQPTEPHNRHARQIPFTFLPSAFHGSHSAMTRELQRCPRPGIKYTSPLGLIPSPFPPLRLQLEWLAFFPAASTSLSRFQLVSPPEVEQASFPGPKLCPVRQSRNSALPGPEIQTNLCVGVLRGSLRWREVSFSPAMVWLRRSSSILMRNL